MLEEARFFPSPTQLKAQARPSEDKTVFPCSDHSAGVPVNSRHLHPTKCKKPSPSWAVLFSQPMVWVWVSILRLFARVNGDLCMSSS